MAEENHDIIREGIILALEALVEAVQDLTQRIAVLEKIPGKTTTLPEPILEAHRADTCDHEFIKESTVSGIDNRWGKFSSSVLRCRLCGFVI